MPSRPKKLSPAEAAAQEALAKIAGMAAEAYAKVWGIERVAEYARPMAEQIANFTNSGFVLQTKQWEMASCARLCDFRCPSCVALHEQGLQIKKDCPDCGPQFIGVGGARGGGKSQWMVAQVAIDDCLRFPGLSFLYVRKSAKTLRSQIRNLLAKTCRPGSYNYREQVGEISFHETASMITVRHFKDESEIDNFLGEEYDGIAYEELTTLSKDKFDNLNSVRRTSKKGWRPRVYASWNWGGIGHRWVYDFFYNPWKNRREIKTRYVLALVQDNRFNDPEYVGQLQDYVGWKYQSWYLGNPEIAAGNFFTHYREDVHVYPCACIHCKSESTFIASAGKIKCAQCSETFDGITFTDDEAVRWFGSMDYGSSMPNCFHLHAEKSNGDCHTVGEVHTADLTIADNCEQFKDLCRLHNVSIDELEFIASGEDVNKTDRETRKDGSTIKTEFEENSIHLTCIHIDRVNAFSQMQECLGDPDRGKRPTWYIHRSCVNLRVQIQTAQYDDKRPNDIIKQNADKETGEGGSDALESARNGIVGRHNSVIADAKPIQMGGYQSPKELSGETIDVSGVVVLDGGAIIPAEEVNFS